MEKTEEKQMLDFLEMKQFKLGLLGDTRESFRKCFLELANSEDKEEKQKFFDTRMEISKMVIPSPCDDIELRKWCIEQCNRGGCPDIPKADELYRYVMSGHIKNLTLLTTMSESIKPLSK